MMVSLKCLQTFKSKTSSEVEHLNTSSPSGYIRFDSFKTNPHKLCRKSFNYQLHKLSCLTAVNIFSRGNYLSAIGCFRLQVVECDKFSEQTTLLVASLHPAKLKVRLWLEEDEPQVDGEARHVDGKGPMGVEHRLPAVDLSGSVDLGGLVPQAAHEGHGPHWNFPSRSHLAREESRKRNGGGERERISQLRKRTWQMRHGVRASAASVTAEAWTEGF